MGTVSALKVGCGKFFHGPGVISLLPSEIRRLGGKAFIVGGPTTLDIVLGHVGAELEAEGLDYTAIKHTDYCTTPWAHRYADEALAGGYTVMVGVGGGKVLDEMKCAAFFAELPIITVPTSIATCVATSMVCIMYNEKGQRAPAVNLAKEVDVCIADTAIIADAPRRTLAAGILDSMAKMPESFHQKHIEGYRDCTLEEYIQAINSRAIFEFLNGEARDLYRNGIRAKRFNDVVLTNLLHTSIVSGFADGSGQLAIAHATYDFLRNYNTEESYRFLHGEMVAVGLLIQMAYNGTPTEEIEALRRLMADLDMPLTLSELHYTCDEAGMALFLSEVARNSNVVGPDDMEKLRTAIGEAL
ncbi:MAG: iron-containing alcohol dehydrogenase [Oscillospiraceae bacterium]|nr:iron-containing alcohol dehydrogenase [Oscillospiraceae bacterium]